MARKQNWTRISAEARMAKSGFEPFHLEESVVVPEIAADAEPHRVRRKGAKPPAHSDVAMSMVKNCEASTPSVKAIAVLRRRVDRLKGVASDEKNAATKNAKFSWSEVERRLRKLESRVKER